MKNIVSKIIKHISSSKRNLNTESIDLTQLKQMKGQGAIILDVRSPQEYKEKHIQGSILIPIYELYVKVQYVIKNKEQTIIAYCLSGSRSKQAIKILKKIGYTNLYQLKDGINAYPTNDNIFTN